MCERRGGEARRGGLVCMVYSSYMHTHMHRNRKRTSCPAPRTHLHSSPSVDTSPCRTMGVRNTNRTHGDTGRGGAPAPAPAAVAAGAGAGAATWLNRCTLYSSVGTQVVMVWFRDGGGATSQKNSKFGDKLSRNRMYPLMVQGVPGWDLPCRED